MAVNDALLVIGATAMKNSITHVQAHNGAPGAGYTGNVVGSRAAASGSVDADGDITLTGTFTGLSANQAITHLSYWSALTSGNNYGGSAINASAPNDTTANAAGEAAFTVVETSTAS